MNIKVLKAYIQLCVKENVDPTAKGLKQFRKERY